MWLPSWWRSKEGFWEEKHGLNPRKSISQDSVWVCAHTAQPKQQMQRQEKNMTDAITNYVMSMDKHNQVALAFWLKTANAQRSGYEHTRQHKCLHALFTWSNPLVFSPLALLHFPIHGGVMEEFHSLPFKVGLLWTCLIMASVVLLVYMISLQC